MTSGVIYIIPIGSPLVMFEAVSEDDPNAAESGTWTFYRVGTAKGGVTLRWYGASNGYYSESVSFDVVKEPRSP